MVAEARDALADERDVGGDAVKEDVESEREMGDEDDAGGDCEEGEPEAGGSEDGEGDCVEAEVSVICWMQLL